MKAGIATWTLAAICGVGVSAAQEVFVGGAGSSYYGSVPGGSATADVLALSLKQAIERGLKTNLSLLLSDQRIQAARGAQAIARSELLPDVSARVAEASQQINLAAFGFNSFPGIAPIVGPFGLFDIRGQVSQTIFNLQSINNARASSRNIRAAELQVRDTRDAVTLVVAELYLQTVTAASRIEAAQAQVASADALYNQAVDFKKAGTVPAIDVLRAQVELQSQRQRLISFRNDHEKQKLRLARAIGLPDGQEIRLTDEISYQQPQPMGLQEALQQAYQARMDYKSLAARVESMKLSLKAADAGRLPTLDFHGDYGAIGQSPMSSHGTYSATVSLNIPIFQGGKVRGEVAEAEAAARQLESQLADLRGQIAFEVRSAMLDSKAAADRVEVSQSAVALARQQETQARDRFAAGVTNNLEVVQAQEALAAANENYISSLYGFCVSGASLARATGSVETNLTFFLSGVKP
jgi:outer membrane protein TolC